MAKANGSAELGLLLLLWLAAVDDEHVRKVSSMHEVSLVSVVVVELLDVKMVCGA